MGRGAKALEGPAIGSAASVANPDRVERARGAVAPLPVHRSSHRGGAGVLKVDTPDADRRIVERSSLGRSGARKSLAMRAVSEVKVPRQDLNLRATVGQQNLAGRSRHVRVVPLLATRSNMTLVDPRRSRGRRTAEHIAVEIEHDWHHRHASGQVSARPGSCSDPLSERCAQRSEAAPCTKSPVAPLAGFEPPTFGLEGL